MKLRKILSYLASIALLLNLASPFFSVTNAALGEIVADTSGTGISLSWDPMVDAVNYKVYRRQSFGTLSAAASQSSPDSGVTVAGNAEVITSVYDFSSIGEDYIIEKLTVINDFSGAFDTPDATGQETIETVYLEYNDINGVQQTVSGVMSAGRVIFSGLDIYAEDGETASVTIKADITAIGDEGLSGMEYRLGIQDTGNDSTTFSAVGQTSAHVENDPTITNPENANKFTVRKSKPVFSSSQQSSNLLISGQREIFKTNITAVGDAIEFGRLIFDITPYGFVSPGDDISNLIISRNGSVIAFDDIEIWCTDSEGNNPHDIKSGSADSLEDCDGTDGDGIAPDTYKAIVSFDSSQNIAIDETVTYSLKANINGVNFDDSVTVGIADGDENSALTGLTSVTNPNTGKAYVDSDAASGIFTALATDFSQLLGVSKNIIWSDKSATSHVYPTVVNGDVATDTGSYDFTNGYLLNTGDLTDHVYYADGSAPPDPELTVEINSGFTSHTAVQGEADESVFAIDLIGDANQSIPVSQITLRLYADSEGGTDFSASGDTAASDFVSSVTLYDDTDADIGGGAETLSLVDTDEDTFFTPDSTEYYEVVFTTADLVIPAGETVTFTAKANLFNTLSATSYLAIDVNPTEDIVATDAYGNPLIPLPAASLNAGAGAHDPEITILTNGTLTAISENNPNSDILPDGSSENLVARYTFNAGHEDYIVDKITIVNDLTGDFGDGTVATTAIDTNGVTIKYPDVSDVIQSVSGTLTGGTVTFSSQTFYVDAGEDSILEIYADISSTGLEALSGEEFRLGLQNTNNSGTFNAVGQTSSNVKNFEDADPTANITDSSSVNPFVVRGAKPIFTKNTGASTTLVDGERELYNFNVEADGGIGLARIVFDVTTYGLSNISDFKLSKNGGAPMANVNFYCPDAGAMTDIDLAGTGDLDDCDGVNDFSTENNTYKVIVSFNTEEAITDGATNTYQLKATISGADTGNTLATSIATGDDSVQLTGLSNATNSNTGKVYVDSDGTAGIFTTGSTDFRQVLGTERNIIWTDKSNASHSYPTVTDGDVTTDTGSSDFTNGYLLDISGLGSHTMTYAYNMNGASRAYAKASIWDLLIPKAYADFEGGTLIGTVTVTNFQDVDVTPGIKYDYYAEGYDGSDVLVGTAIVNDVTALTGSFDISDRSPDSDEEGVNSTISQIEVLFNGEVDPDAITFNQFVYLCIGDSWDEGGADENNYCSGDSEFISISTAVNISNSYDLIITLNESLSDDTWYTVIIQDTARNNYGDGYFAPDADGETITDRWKFKTLSDAVYDSATDGQAEITPGETTVELSDNTVMDLSGGTSTDTVGGDPLTLNDFTRGDLTNEDLSNPRVVGNVTVEIEKVVQLESGTDGEDITVSNINYPDAELTIQDGTAIMGDADWDGKIIPPREAPESGLLASGFSVGDTIVEAGASNGVLLFDRPVSVIINGIHSYVGYKPAGSNIWTRIVVTCGGTYESPSAPVFPGECFINNGVDKTKIYTYHLTTFGSLNYTSPTTTPTTTVTGGGGGGGGGYRNIQVAQTRSDTGESEAGGTAETTMHRSASVQAIKFLDIKKHWAESYIQNIAERGIVDGKTDVRYAPNDNISRAELIKIAMNSFGHSVAGSVNEKPSGDVSIGDWSAPYIKSARDNGVIFGMEDSFGPNAPATRAFASTVLVKAAGFNDVTENYQNNYSGKSGYTYVGFPDVGMNKWYSEYIGYLKDEGVVEGYPDGTFGVNKKITRAEIAKIAVKLIEKWESEQGEAEEPAETTPEVEDDEILEEE